MLGLGFGGLPRQGITPLAAMAGYLDEMDALTTSNPLPRTPMRRILTAYGPKMLELARERSAGALTYHVTWRTPHERGRFSGRTRSWASSSRCCSSPIPHGPARPRGNTST